MAFNDNSYQVTGKVCPPSLPMSMMLSPDQWSSQPILPGILQSLMTESSAQEIRASLPESLCAVVSQAQVLLSTNEESSMSSVVSLPYYFCNFCNHHTDSRALLLKHLAQKHVFQCNICNFSSFNRCSLIQHQLRSHIDATELHPVLSTKFVQVSLPQLERTLQTNGLFSGGRPQQHRARGHSSSQVSSATSHHENNFLLPVPQTPSNPDHDSVSTTQHGSVRYRDNFLTSQREDTSHLPHFLDVEHSCVSSSNVPLNTHDSSASQDIPDMVNSNRDSEAISTASSYATASIPESESFVENTISTSDQPRSQREIANSVSSPNLGYTSTQSNRSLNSKLPACSGVDSSSLLQTVDNFLMEDSTSKEMQLKGQNKSTRSNEANLGNEQRKKNYDILRGLLVGEPSPDRSSRSSVEKQLSNSGQATASAVREPKNTVSEVPSAAVSAMHKRTQPKRPSDMSLMELLMQPGASHSSEDSKLKANFSMPTAQKLPKPTIVLVCGFCNFECHSKAQLLAHVNTCQQRSEPLNATESSDQIKNALSESTDVAPKVRDSGVVRCGKAEKEIAGGLDSVDTPMSKTRCLQRDGCIASEMLRSISQTISESESQNGQHKQALAWSCCAQTETTSKPTGGSSAEDQNTQHTVSLGDQNTQHTVSLGDQNTQHTVSLGDQNTQHTVSLGDQNTQQTVSLGDQNTQQHTMSLATDGARKSHRLVKRKCVYRELSVSDEDDDDGDGVRYPRRKKIALKRNLSQDEDENSGDDEYVNENDHNSSCSEDSYNSSCESTDEGKIRKRCKRLRVGVAQEERTESAGNVLTCLHCSFSSGNNQTIRRHLRVNHPAYVPFAEASTDRGKKTIVYFCQGFSDRCFFVSSRAAEIFSHIRLCFVELLDGFNSECQENMSSVLNSLGIASKLMDSSPSTYYCLRCDYTKHSLQPLEEHVAGSHGGIVAGVLHVTIGNQHSKQTKVHMMCLVCRTDIPVNQWQSHQCRMCGNKEGRIKSKELMTAQSSKSSDKGGEEGSVQVSFVEGRRSTELVSALGAAEVVFSKSDSGLKSEFAGEMALFKTDGPKEENLYGAEDVSCYQAAHVHTVDENLEDNCENERFTGISLLEEQHSEERNVCVISNCFSVDASSATTSSVTSTSQSITESLLTSPAVSTGTSWSSKEIPAEKTPSSIQDTSAEASTKIAARSLDSGSSKNDVTHGPTSVLHGLLVSNPPDLSSTRALTLLQNLLTGSCKNNSESPSRSTEVVPRDSDLGSPMQNPVIAFEQRQTKRSGASSCLPTFSQTESQCSASTSTFSPSCSTNKPLVPPLTIKSEAALCVSDKTPNPSVVCSGFPSEPVKLDPSSKSKHLGEALSQLPAQEMSSPKIKTFGEHTSGHSRGSLRASEPPSSPPATTPTPPQLPHNHRPLSPSSPSRLPGAWSSQSSAGVPLFSSTRSEPLQASPFTNLLRGLLSISQRKDKENK